MKLIIIGLKAANTNNKASSHIFQMEYKSNLQNMLYATLFDSSYILDDNLYL